MKSIGVYYFSGTGNTALVANTVKETFAQLGYTVDLVRIEDVLKKDLPLDLRTARSSSKPHGVIG